MATVRPFQAVRPAQKYAEQMISLPYDVMNRAEAKQMAQGNPVSFLHICRSEIDLPDQCDPYSKEVYEKAKSNIDEFLDSHVLIRDEKPMLYLYRQIMDGRAQTGIVGCVSVDEYQKNIIKKHEFTRVEKELDRINHFDVCDANTEPVFLTYRDSRKIDAIVEGWISSHSPEYDLTTPDKISHIFWKIDEWDTIQQLTELFAGIGSLYIADGHHRSASAAKVGMKRREEYPDFDGSEEFNYFMAVIFPDKDLKIFDYNRVVKDLNGLSKEELLQKLSSLFDLDEMGSEGQPYIPEEKHTFSMFLDHQWYRLKAKPELLSTDIIKGLDVSILQEHVLAPLLGIADPRTDKRIDFVGGIRGLSELEKRANSDMCLAFAVYPVSIEDLLSVADQNKVMPPKSTWFEPKLGSGLFIHEL